MKQNVVTKRARHLFVVPRRCSIDEVYDDLLALRRQLDLKMPIKKFRRNDDQSYTTKIVKQIVDCAAEYTNDDDHCCLIISQAAFQLIDPSVFAGWHLKLDELLTNGNPSGTLFAPAMWRGFDDLIAIEPLTDQDRARGIPDDLRRIRLRGEVKAGDLMNDPHLTKSDQDMLRRAGSPVPVYTDASSTEDLRQRKCQWCSPWTLDLAVGFASVEIAACDIEESLMHQLAPRPYEVVPIHSPVSAATIRIFYFDAGASTCSSDYWETEQGRANLERVGKAIASRCEVDFWTCNRSAETVLKPLMRKTSGKRKYDKVPLNPVDGTWITQQQDGANIYRACESCAIIISSKAQEHEGIFAKLNAAATRKAISQGREGGLIFQFATRGAIRNAAFAGDYTVYVYDRQQAEALRDKLVAYDYPHTEIEHVKLDGFVDRVREPKGRKPLYVTPEHREAANRRQNAERQQRHRAKRKMLAAE